MEVAALEALIEIELEKLQRDGHLSSIHSLIQEYSAASPMKNYLLKFVGDLRNGENVEQISLLASIGNTHDYSSREPSGSSFGITPAICKSQPACPACKGSGLKLPLQKK